jgi:ketosteroid isomerase-like protein
MAMTDASGATARQFADDRLAAFGRGDAAALVAQYRDDAVVITPQGKLAGPQIRGMIEGIVAEFAQPGVKFDLIAREAEGPVATFVWKAETARNLYELGSETYVLKDGKVAYQTFAAKVTPR